MHSVDISGNLALYLTDPKRKIPKAHLNTVCKKGKFPDQCRYVATTPKGCWCAKATPIKVTLDGIVSKSKGGARGDNCPGFEGSGQFGVETKPSDPESR